MALVSPARAEELISVRIASEPAGARIFINGAERGQTPASLSLPTGESELFIYKDGYMPVRKMVRWQGGDRPIYRETLRKQTGGLVVLADPPGAKVFLDQRPLGAAPLAYENLQPGFYQVEVRRDGFKPFVATLELLKDRARVVNVRLEGPPVTVFVEGDAGARVYLDGSYAGEITDTSLILRARAGTHELRIERNGFASVQTLLLEPGRDVAVGMGELKRMPDARGDEVVKANPRWYVVAVSLGAGAVGGGLAVVSYVAARGAREDYDNAWRRAQISDAKGRIEQNNLLFAVGSGVFAAGLTGAWLAWPTDQGKIGVTVAPSYLGLHARFP
jgi:hypothetical protein